MGTAALATGLFLAICGSVLALKPQVAAQLHEAIQAIGSRRSWHTVEPTDWFVQLTRGVGVLLVLGGVGFAVLGG